MLKSVKQIKEEVKGIKKENVKEAMVLGGRLTVGWFKLMIMLTRFLRMNIVSLKMFSRIVKFYEGSKEKYEDLIAIVDTDELSQIESISVLITQLRRETVMKGMKLPFEIHSEKKDDEFGIYGLKFVLCDVREGEEGLKAENALWINDGKGNVYTYFPMLHNDYRRYLKRLDRHPLKDFFFNTTTKGPEDYNTKLIYLDLN